MEPIANHSTLSVAKRTMVALWKAGEVRPPAKRLRIPVLTTSNRKNTILGDVMKHDPLFHLDIRDEKWDWWLKIKSAEEHAKKFKEEGFEYFLYLDSNDGFIWRSFTEKDCEEFLEGKSVRFQEHLSGYPDNLPVSGAFRAIHETPCGGVCAGCYIARTDGFQELTDVIRVLRKVKASVVSAPGEWKFDDQAAWRALACLMPERVGVQSHECAAFTRVTPTKDIWTNFKSRGLGDTVKKVTDKMGWSQCGGCEKRQGKLNRLIPYEKTERSKE